MGTKIKLNSVSIKSWGDYFNVEVFNDYGGGVGQLSLSEAKQLHPWFTDQLGLGWVSVEERLPEELQPVLVEGDSVNTITNCEVAWITTFFDEDPQWTCRIVKNVKHWMPLPQLPEDK